MNAPDEKSGGHRVLVLMATFNGATWLREQVCSIVAQQGVAVSLAVRDDASADRTLETLRDALGPDDGGLQLFRATSPGGSPAGNFFHLMQAVDAAGHDFVALADQDDIWDVRKLSRAVECLQRSGAAGYSATVCAVLDGWPIRSAQTTASRNVGRLPLRRRRSGMHLRPDVRLLPSGSTHTSSQSDPMARAALPRLDPLRPVPSARREMVFR